MIALGSVENINWANELILLCLRKICPADFAWRRPTGPTLAAFSVVKNAGSGDTPAGQPGAVDLTSVYASPLSLWEGQIQITL